jgi:hypothetical protein
MDFMKFIDPEAETVAMDIPVAAAAAVAMDIGVVVDSEVTDVDEVEVIPVVGLVGDAAQMNLKDTIHSTPTASPIASLFRLSRYWSSPSLVCGINGELVCHSIACVLMAG